MQKYYTYAYLREDGTPYYIGKGSGNRLYSYNRSINRPKDKSRIIILKDGMSEEDSFRHEIYMIHVLGKKINGGLLHNKTDGGEGVSGYVMSDETRKKQSIAAKNRVNLPHNKKYFTEDEKREAKRKRQREYQRKIRGERKEYMKEWRANNQDKIKKYKEENKENLKDLWKRHREQNKEKRNEYSKWYYHNVVKPLKEVS